MCFIINKKKKIPSWKEIRKYLKIHTESKTRHTIPEEGQTFNLPVKCFKSGILKIFKAQNEFMCKEVKYEENIITNESTIKANYLKEEILQMKYVTVKITLRLNNLLPEPEKLCVPDNPLSSISISLSTSPPFSFTISML